MLIFFLAAWLALNTPSVGTHSPQASTSANRAARGAPSTEKKSSPRQAYVGDDACRSCHREQAGTFPQTAHHLTSRAPSARSIAGSFTSGSNVLHTSNPYLSFVMNANKDGYFESAVEQLSASKTMTHTERIDVVVGSGRKGQSFLFWKGDELFELPVSYWTELKGWVNSPGYPDGSPHFDKAIVPRCLECHGSSFEWAPPPLNRFRKTGLVLGITCEKCHGPGRDHVALYSSKPALPPGAAKAIINPALLSRDRQIDLCALCHAGAATPITPPLSFVPGDAIDDHLYTPDSGEDVPVDVHGNQVRLLKRSRCYRSSAMTCTTCHDVHQPQRDAAAFSPRCLACHKVEACGRYARMGDAIARNCVDCHMPLQPSETLVSDTNGRKLKPLVRNHQIGIFPDAQLP